MLPFSSLIAAVVAATVTVVLAIIGATWKVSSRLGDIARDGAVLSERVAGIAQDVTELKADVKATRRLS